ncbi:hypothetical protein M569_15165, partial [Genlisea aurea]
AVAAAPPVRILNNISSAIDAAFFKLYYGQSFKVIKNGLDGKSYLLIQSNSKMAAKTKYCTSRIKSFVVPLANYSIDTDSFPGVSFFVFFSLLQQQILGLLGSLKGVTSEYLASECALKLYNEGQIQMIDKYEPQQLNQFSAHFTVNTDQQQLCNLATFLPTVEEDPLRRVEWIKYLGVFANLETRANQVYDQIKQSYTCLSKVAGSRKALFKPTVAWMEYDNGIWSFTKEAYKLKYVEDAGGVNIDESINKVTYNVSDIDDLEAFNAVLCTVDVVIDGTRTPDPTAYSTTTFLRNLNMEVQSCFAFMANQSVWRYDKRTLRNSTVLDWYDGAISQPHVVLADVIEALFPTGNYTTVYLRNVAKGEGVTNIGPEMCVRDCGTPMDPTSVPCQ